MNYYAFIIITNIMYIVLQQFDIIEIWSLNFPEGESIAAIGRRSPNGTKIMKITKIKIIYAFL
jgi:hypothetical protein